MKNITIAFEVDDDVIPEDFEEAITKLVYEELTSYQDILISGIANVTLIKP